MGHMKAPRPLSVRGMTPDEAAAAFIVRINDGPLSEADQATFDEWKAQSPVNVAAFERAEAAWNLFDDPRGDPLLDAMRSSALAAGPGTFRKNGPGIVIGIAVLLAGAAALNTGWLPFGQKADTQRVAARSAPASVAAPKAPTSGEFVTAKGERRTVRLADGTAITLNTDSAVRVGYVAERRLVRLLRGQALFEVAKDPHRPFVVQAGAKQITALGTVFEVRLFDSDRMKVTLVEGKVVVDEGADRPDADAPVMVPAVLSPGQTLLVSENMKPVRFKVDTAQQLRWREGFVEFNDATLADAAEEMNRYSGKQIIIGDPAVGKLRVSGVFRTGSPERFAAIVGELLPVRQRALTDGDIELSAGGR